MARGIGSLRVGRVCGGRTWWGMFWIAVGLFASSSAAAQQDRALFQQGRRAFDEGDFDGAIRAYEQAIEKNPNSAPFYDALGMAHLSAGMPPKEAAWFFEVATQIDPQYVPAWVNLCRAYHQAQAFEDAERTCLRALELSPESPSARLTLAWVYLTGRHEPAKAVEAFEAVLPFTRSPQVYLGLGLAYALAGDRGKALEVITTLREMGREDFARRLEDALRPHPSPEVTPRAVPPLPPGSGGRLVGAEGRPPRPEPERPRLPISGTLRIRLRGRLTNLPSSGSDEAPSSRRHPGSLSSE